MAAGGCAEGLAEDRKSAPPVPKRILLFVSISMGLYCLVCCLANTASWAQTIPEEDICRHPTTPPPGCDTGAESAAYLPPPSTVPALEPITPPPPNFAAFCQKLGYEVNPDFVSFILTPLTLPFKAPPPVEAHPIALAPGENPLLAGSGANLTPIAEPPGAYVLPSYLCGIPDASAGLQAALNAAAGGALWIPDGCIVNTYATSDISSNTTIACGVGATIHSTQPLSRYGAPSPLESHGGSNITIEGCTFTGMYTPSMAAQGHALCIATYPALQGGTLCCDNVVSFYGGSNLTFTDNAVTNQFSDEGVFFDQSSNVTISNNYFAYDYNNSIQLSECHNCNVTGNTSLDTNWDQEDATPEPAGTSTGTWSNNVFSCDSTGTGNLSVAPGVAAFYGGTCVWKIGG
jgi:hypothetical protein